MKKILLIIGVVIGSISCSKEECVTCNAISFTEGTIKDTNTSCDKDEEEAFRQAFNGTESIESTVIQCDK